MTAITLRGLWARKLRAGLTALAVVLGVMMISGTYVFTDTINHSFDRIFDTANKGVDVKVVPHKTIDTQEIQQPPFSESLLPKVRSAKGVAKADGGVNDVATVFDKNGKRLNKGGAPALMFSSSPEPFNPLTYVQGHAPASANEVTLDQHTADDHGFKIGQTVLVGSKLPAKRYVITGIGKFGDVSEFGGATIAIFTLPEAQRISEKRGRLDEIDVAVAKGFTSRQVTGELRNLLPATVDVKTGAQDAKDQANDIQDGLSFLNTLLLSFAGIALFVGAFIIFNTFSITVAQRTTEIGLLRTMGASRRQILRSVILEALIIGLGASIVGLFAGILAAKGITALFKGFGIDLPSQGTVVLARTVIVSLLVGTIVTIVAGLSPARRATRVPPLAALRDDVMPAGRAGRRRTVIASLLTGFGVLLLALGLFVASGASSVLGLMAVGAIAVFIGVALLSNKLVPPIASVVGWPLEKLRGLTGRLARENTERNPSRTAVTAAALMIGLALVTFVTVLAAGLRASINDTVDKNFAGDLVLTNKDGFSPIPSEAGRAVTRVPGVAAVSPINSSAGKVKGVSGNTSVDGIDPRTYSQVWKAEIKKGPSNVLATLGPRDATLVDDFAKSNNFKIGDRLSILTPTAKTIVLTVRGTVDNKGGIFNPVTTSYATVRRDFRQPDDSAVLIKTDPGASVKGVQTRIDKLLDTSFPIVRSQDQQQYKDDITKQVNQILYLVYALLSLSIIVSLFGIVNTLVLSIYERTRELGMMRAIGTSRRQVRRIVRYESLITAMIGGVLGLLIGLLLGAMTTVALKDQGFTLQIPVVPLLIFLVVTAIAGVLAAIPPARRASRLDVLQALAYE
jgi:putative ABC transport system permease protein